MPHPNNKQDKNRNLSSADRISTSLNPAHQRGKKKKKPQHISHSIQRLHKPLNQPYEGRNQKEERVQPGSLGKGYLKQNKL